MKTKKYKPYAFKSVKEEKINNSNCAENVEPAENSCSYTLSDFCAKMNLLKKKFEMTVE
jgi:hypothetical protein